MTKIFAVAGKGGVGKSTISALLTIALAEKGNIVLAVDADPNTNLDEKLGIEMEGNIGEARENISKNVDNLPSGISKPEYVKLKIQETVSEGDNYDILAMGRQEGPGCYCYINQLLRTFIDSLAEKYRYVVIDNEAGMEHLSRRTCKDVDTLFIVSDPTVPGVKAAIRIKELAQKMEIKVGKFALLINRSAELPDYLKELVENAKFDSVDLLPEDDEVRETVERGEPLSSLSGTSPFKKKVERLAIKFS
jgi:CO dehydrogenase maturation factor